MKNITCILCLAATIGCRDAAATGPAVDRPALKDDRGDHNKAVVAKFMDAELKGDTAAMSELLSDDYIQYGLGVNDATNKAKTLEGVRHHWEVYKYGGKRFKRIQSIALTTTEDGGRGRGKGDWVFEWGDLAIDYPTSPDYGGKAVTATFAYHSVYQVKDGKINARTIYFNHEDIMKQLGYKYLSVPDQAKVAGVKLTYK